MSTAYPENLLSAVPFWSWTQSGPAASQRHPPSTCGPSACQVPVNGKHMAMSHFCRGHASEKGGFTLTTSTNVSKCVKQNHTLCILSFNQLIQVPELAFPKACLGECQFVKDFCINSTSSESRTTVEGHLSSTLGYLHCSGYSSQKKNRTATATFCKGVKAIWNAEGTPGYTPKLRAFTVHVPHGSRSRRSKDLFCVWKTRCKPQFWFLIFLLSFMWISWTNLYSRFTH